MKTGKYFQLFANCIPVRGAKRSVICDLQRNTVRFIPNDLFDVIVFNEGESFLEVVDHYSKDHETLMEYFEFLQMHEYGFWCDEPMLFPKLELLWESPACVTNAIIDFDSSSHHPLAKIITELDSLGCKALQLRLYTPRTTQEIEAILTVLDLSRIESVELLICYTPEWKERALALDLFKKFLRLNYLIIHSSPVTDRIETGFGIVYLTSEKIISCSSCGIVNSNYFVVNMGMFTESLNFNSCLNRKISIDAQGFIKNCPSLEKNFGNINDISLVQALENTEIKEFWNVTKDSIEVCKDCEFRYICTDCRAYTTLESDKLSKPLKCSYDPYTARWL